MLFVEGLHLDFYPSPGANQTTSPELPSPFLLTRSSLALPHCIFLPLCLICSPYQVMISLSSSSSASLSSPCCRVAIDSRHSPSAFIHFTIHLPLAFP